MNKNRSGKRLTLIGGAMLALSSGPAMAQASLSLPMKYYEDPTVKPVGITRILVGAKLETGTDTPLGLKPSGRLWVAPTEAKVTGSKFDRYNTANCDVIKYELEKDDSIALLMKKFEEERVTYDALRRKLVLAHQEATAACLAAIDADAADADAICAKVEKIQKLKENVEAAAASAEWVKQLQDAADYSTKRLEQFGNQAGGFAVATVSTFSEDELNKVRQANPKHQVSFVPLKNISFAFTPAEHDKPLSQISMRTTLGFSLAGKPLPPDQQGGSAEAVAAIASGGSVAIGVTLSRLGACEPELVRAGTFTYEYDSFAFVHGKAHINKWAAYERLEENSTKGGLFSTKAVRKLYEDMQSGQNANVEIIGAGTGYDPVAQHKQLEAQVLQDLLTSMADIKAMSTSPTNTLGLPTLGQNGATVMADGLQKCVNVWCVGSGFVLKGLSAIFGGTNTRDEAKRLNNTKVTREFSFNTSFVDIGSADTIIDWEVPTT